MKFIFNGQLVTQDFGLPLNSRAILFSDSVYELFWVENSKVVNLEPHYFDLCAFMRINRLKIPESFTQEYIEEQILKLSSEANLTEALFRFQVFRKSLEESDISYFVGIEEVKENQEVYKVDIYKSYLHQNGLHQSVQSPNALQGYGKVYAKENDLDDVLLLNYEKQIVQSINGIPILQNGNKITIPVYTHLPAKLKWLIEQIKEIPEFELTQELFHPFKVSQADGFFIFKNNYNLQKVTHFRKKEFILNESGIKLLNLLNQ